MKKETHLPLTLAWAILALAVAACFGELFPEIGRLAGELKKADPWNFPDALWHGLPKYFVLLVTAAIAWKQMSYYYVKGGTKGAVFSTVILHMNAIERSLDWLLAVEGALLLPWATFFPTTWAFGYFLYCLIGLMRMIVTLRRPVYADRWSRREYAAPLTYLWSTYPFNWVGSIQLPGLPAKSTGLSKKEQLLWTFANSLLAHHTPRDNPHKASSVRELLWGWRVSFCAHGAIALILGIATIVIWAWLGPAVARWAAIGSAAIITVLFYSFSQWSFRKGKEKYSDVPAGRS